VVWSLVLACLAGCKKREAESVPVPVPAPAVQAAGQGEDALLRALSVRDGEPTCASFAALVPDDPVGALIRVVDTVELPPVAPMRAAQCLVAAHAEAAEATLTRWMTEPGSEGYVRVVLAGWDQIPTPVAVRIATVGLAGPHAGLVQASVRAAVAPELRALAP